MVVQSKARLENRASITNDRPTICIINLILRENLLAQIKQLEQDRQEKSVQGYRMLNLIH